MTGTTPLTCQQLVELVTDYLDGALDEATRQRFDDHLGLCPGCEIYLRQMQETARRLGTIPVDTLSSQARETLLTAFRDFHG